MGFDLIQDHFDLPAFVITVDEVKGRGGAGIEPGGGQAIDLIGLSQASIGDAIFDHPQKPRLDPLSLLLFAGHVDRQIAAPTRVDADTWADDGWAAAPSHAPCVHGSLARSVAR